MKLVNRPQEIKDEINLVKILFLTGLMHSTHVCFFAIYGHIVVYYSNLVVSLAYDKILNWTFISSRH